MSTNDVPGSNPSNHDQLGCGSWAEHEDGSLIFVQSTEGGRIVYMMFDTMSDTIIEYRDAMPERAFKQAFSWKPTDQKSIKWVWHDKTPFPWDRIIKDGAKDGLHFASADDQLSAAEKVARSLNLRSRKFNAENYAHMVDKVKKGAVSNRMVRAIQAAINELRA